MKQFVLMMFTERVALEPEDQIRKYVSQVIGPFDSYSAADEFNHQQHDDAGRIVELTLPPPPGDAKFLVYWINHGYFSQETFTTVDDAIKYGVDKGFEFSVYQESANVRKMVASFVSGAIHRY